MSLEAPIKAGSYIRGAEFEGDGMALTVLAGPEKVPASEAKFGDDDGNVTQYPLGNDAGDAFVFQSNNKSLATQFNEAALEIGDKILIKRSGTGMKTAFTVEKVEPVAETV